MAQDSVQTNYVKHDDGTLEKFRYALTSAGYTMDSVQSILHHLQNAGLLIRERVPEEPIPLSTIVEAEAKDPEYVVWNPTEEKMAMRVMADFFGIVRMVKDHFPESEQKNDIIDSILYAQTSTLKMLVGIPA